MTTNTPEECTSLPDTEAEYREWEIAQGIRKAPSTKRRAIYWLLGGALALGLFFGPIRSHVVAWPERNREFWANFEARAAAQAEMLTRENNRCDERLEYLVGLLDLPNPRGKGWGVGREPYTLKAKEEFIGREWTDLSLLRPIRDRDGRLLGEFFDRQRKSANNPDVIERNAFLFLLPEACYDGQVPESPEIERLHFFQFGMT